MRPFYTLTIDGNAIELHNRSINMQVIDKNGMEADELSLDIDDHDGAVAMPTKGQLIEISFGYDNSAMYVGSFVVDEMSHKGPPDVITIRASSADFRQSLLQEREESYHDTTVGGILATIAGRQGLETASDSGLAGIAVEHLDQTNECDANLITRLAQEYDALGTIKDGKLIFVPRATGNTASGRALSSITIERSEGDTHDYNDADRDDQVTGVAGYYQDKDEGKRKKAIVGGGANTHHLKRTYNTEAEATNAAAGKMKKIKTAARKLTLNLAMGRPEIYSEMPITVRGFKDVIDAVSWIATEVTHTLNNSGLSTAVNCEEKA